MSFATSIFPDPLRSISATTFTGSFQALGGPLLHKVGLIKFVNNTSVLVTVSWDGVNNHDVYPAGTYGVFDVTTNQGNEGRGIYIPVGIQFYVNASVGTGSFYMIALYPVYNAP